MDGICTLANDRVYDQLIALLNSIDVMAGQDMPVCVYPYDDNTDRIAAEIARRPNVSLYNDRASIDKWDRFVRQAWDCHPKARKRWEAVGEVSYYRVGTHRRYCAFDGPFDRFIYMDADTLMMSPVKQIFNQLSDYDWVVYDFQYKDPSHVYEVTSPKLKRIFPQQQIASQIFCSGFYATKKDLFDQVRRDWLLAKLQDGEAEILYPMAPDQTLLNYMVMRSGVSTYNFALSLPATESTGCCVTSTHFQEQNHILYDKGKRLTYLHYIGISSRIFDRLCKGKNKNFPYRDLFLHYRYLYEPENYPELVDDIEIPRSSSNLAVKFLRKLGLTS